MISKVRGSVHAVLIAELMVVLPSGSQAQDSDIQKQLSNPIASLTIVPIQNNFDFKIGPAQEGSRVVVVSFQILS
jgi:hypothetical protein